MRWWWWWQFRFVRTKPNFQQHYNRFYPFYSDRFETKYISLVWTTSELTPLPETYETVREGRHRPVSRSGQAADVLPRSRQRCHTTPASCIGCRTLLSNPSPDLHWAGYSPARGRPLRFIDSVHFLLYCSVCLHSKECMSRSSRRVQWPRRHTVGEEVRMRTRVHLLNSIEPSS